jgi:hypothetical protein
MHELLGTTGSWWSYAEGDRTVLGVVVVLLVIAGVGYVGARIWARVRRRRS